MRNLKIGGYCCSKNWDALVDEDSMRGKNIENRSLSTILLSKSKNFNAFLAGKPRIVTFILF
jgi:hypothetical protein